MARATAATNQPSFVPNHSSLAAHPSPLAPTCHLSCPGRWGCRWGVPGSAAAQFEAAAREIAPQLFEECPHLLEGQLVTMIDPRLLARRGVPMVTTVQCANEFVLTFPGAFHAGFNTGFNIAEAVRRPVVYTPASFRTDAMCGGCQPCNECGASALLSLLSLRSVASCR